MDSDSDENSRPQSDLSRFSMNSSNSSHHRSNLSDQISMLTQSLDESVILTKRKKNVKKGILESDSESEDQNESDSDQIDTESGELEGDDLSESDPAESEGDDTKDDQQFAYRVKSDENDVTEDDEADEDKSESSIQQETTHDSSVVVPETDDDEDVKEAEKEASMLVFSPRTRRTITGRRSTFHKPVESDDDEIFPEEKSVSHSDYKSAEASKELESSSDFENNQSENIKRNRSIVPIHDISAIYTPNAKRFSMNKMNSDSISPKTSTPSRSISPDIDFSDKSSASDAHSYHIQSDQSASRSKLSSSSVVILNSDDSDEENRKPNNMINFKGVDASTPGPSKLIQPKLNFDRKPNKTIKTFVSRAYYNKKIDELAIARKECKDNEDLLKNIGSTLPDGGRNLKVRVERLQRELQKKEVELETYAIEEDHMDDVLIVEQPTNNNQPKNVGHDWRSELEKIQPRSTGEQGMSTFNTQKQLTLNRIEKLHKAMEKCPSEDDFARQPENLNVQLMPHQLHAIKWMRWRETQKPKGGILADDMGLGKTLTVIGLVLDDKYGKELSHVEEDDDDDEGDEKDESDDENERGYKKAYKNEGGILIVCPASLINQWEKEIENRVKRRKLSVLMHHGNNRKESAHSICKYDLVISTYGVITSEHKNNSALFGIRWKRVVLDEAHMIRNHSTAVAKGCCDLRSTIRWGLTGTPIQNKHMDVYSMFKFLRITPFDDLATYKKWIDPKTQAGMSRLHNILKPLLLRRTKAELQLKGELKALPSKEILIEDIELTPEEANIYTKILAYSQTLFAQYMEQHQQRMGGGGKVQLPSDIQKRLEQVRRFGQGQDVKSSQILVLLLRLRQICDHPGLINQMLMDECDLENCDEEDFGSIEMNMVKQMIGLKISDHNEQGNVSDEEEAKGNKVLLNTNQIFDFKHPSTKCKRTIEIVKRVLRETNDKIVIVSQWTTFLNVVSDFLNRERVHYVELTGKTPIKDRNNIVVSFNKPNTSERVLMLSLVAGGVGLNLTGANHLILLDPHWNPQLESQAFDRVYRVGQTKDVKIYKLLCVKTIEKHIQNIQDRKLELSDNVLTGSKGSSSKLSIQDMRQLFDM